MTPGTGPAGPRRIPNPTYGDGVVTPHALFLAMHVESREAYDNLRKLERELDAYGEGGFYDAIAVRVGHGRQALPVVGPVDGHGLDR